MLFTSSDEVTKLSHEIEKFDGGAGELVAWVKIPSLSSSANTTIYMYYGNAGASDQQDATNVWDANYKVVQHMEEAAGGTNAILDSTSNANHGSDNGTPTFGASGNISNAIYFDGIDDFINFGTAASLDFTDNITIEAWVSNNSVPTRNPAVSKGCYVSAADSKYILFYSSESDCLIHWIVRHDGNKKEVTNAEVGANQWHHLVGVYDDGSMELFVNGSTVGTETGADLQSTAAYPLLVGKWSTSFFKGLIDEVRISDKARSSDFISTSYNNQGSPSTFYSLGAEQTPAPAPTVTTGSATLVEETTATLHGTLTDDSGENCQYRFRWGTTSGGPYTDKHNMDRQYKYQ
ncbi:DUF2341 domain-containing protein [Chloroflexota bacterium]